MDPTGKDSVAEAMDLLWARFLPQIEARVSALEAAAAALTGGTLIPAHREQAGAEAHKLAGVLGTFGLHEGTNLAREAELAFGERHAENVEAERLAEIAARLRAMVADRK